MTRAGKAAVEPDAAGSGGIAKNFLTILTAQFMTKLGDALASPKTVLPWIMSGVHAPVPLIGLLVPIRESGSLIPQVLIAGWVSRCAIRKWIWVIGSLVQAVCVAAMGFVAWRLDGTAAGSSIVGLLILFSLARSFCSVASKDVLGKTIPKRQRGRLTGLAASGAGLISIVIGTALLLSLIAFSDPRSYGTLLIVAGLLWLAGAVVFSAVSEPAGESDAAESTNKNFRRRLSLLKTDGPFRLFLLTRAALLCSALSGPYYVLMARQTSGEEVSMLGSFIAAGGIASFVSAPLWGRFADYSSRRVMTVAAIVSGLVGVCVYFAVESRAGIAGHRAFFPAAFFVLSLAHEGVRVGRKTYIVDMADGNRRTDYVAVSNTVIGWILLLAGLSGTLSGYLSLAEIVLLLSGFGLVGAVLSTRLREVE